MNKRYLLLILLAVLPFGSTAFAKVTYEGTNVPYIHPRSEWLSTPELQSLFSWHPYNPKAAGEIPDYYPVSRIVVHDTGCNVTRPGCNDDSIDSATLIQNIFRFHAVTRGWGDIGYHYIIDRKGEIWEGRYGGNGVRGAHVYNSATCQNFNVGTVGISVLGNYYDTPMPPAAMESLKKLTAWLAHTNNIDVNATVTTQVWTNPKGGDNKCLTNPGGFTSTFTGPTVLTHRELEANNSDIRTMDFAALWGGSSAVKEELKTYTFQEQGTGGLFEFVQARLQSLANTSKKIVTVIKSQLDIFRPELFAKAQPVFIDPSVPQVTAWADGTLLRPKGKEEVYLIKNQKRVHISSAALFNGLGLKWPDIKDVDEPEVTGLAMADPIVFPDGILLQAQTPDVYYVRNSKRYLISSPEQFGIHKFKWEDIIQLTRPELDRYYPWGGYVKWPDGSVLQNIYNPAQVVVVQNNELSPVKGGPPSSQPVYPVSGREIDSYRAAQVLLPNLALAFTQAFDAVKGKLGLSITTVNEQNVQGSDTPNTAPAVSPSPTPTPPVPSPSPSPAPSPAPAPAPAPSGPEPTIKIGLCKTRNTGGDMNKCAFAPGDILRISTDEHGISTVDGYYDNPGFNPGLNDNRFRGKVYTVAQGDNVWLVNELPMEDYLKGIAETLGTDNPEYRKVLITIARTYAYYYLTQDKKYPGMPFDLINLSYSQVYRGYNYELRSNGLPLVVASTRGQVVTFNGKPIVGAYSSDSGGVTKNACPTIFPKYCNADGTNKAEYLYLKGGVADPEGTVHNQAKIAASHGVGMSAIGARTMIDRGKAFAQVIAYYFPGVNIEKLY